MRVWWLAAVRGVDAPQWQPLLLPGAVSGHIPEHTHIRVTVDRPPPHPRPTTEAPGKVELKYTKNRSKNSLIIISFTMKTMKK